MIQKRHINNDIAILHNEINCGQLYDKNKQYLQDSMSIESPHEEKKATE